MAKFHNLPRLAGALVFCLTLLNFVKFSQEINFKEDTTLTKQQSRAFKRFKESVTPKLTVPWHKEDYNLLRFLRAKKFDTKKAEDYLLSQLKWRKEYKMDGIHREDFSDLEHEYGMRVKGVDRDGRPLLFLEIGDWDIRKLAIAGKTDRLLRYTFKNVEAARVAVREMELQNKNITRFTIVADLKNINAVTNVNTACFPYYLSAAIGYDLHWPHTGDKIYLLNTPALFEIVLNLVRPVLSQGTRDALQVFGKGKEAEWGPIVRAAIDPSQLPQRYGGTQEDP